MFTYLYYNPNGTTETLHATHAELSPDESRLWLTHPEPIDLGGNGDPEDMFTEVGYPVGQILPVPAEPEGKGNDPSIPTAEDITRLLDARPNWR